MSLICILDVPVSIPVQEPAVVRTIFGDLPRALQINASTVPKKQTIASPTPIPSNSSYIFITTFHSAVYGLYS